MDDAETLNPCHRHLDEFATFYNLLLAVANCPGCFGVVSDPILL